LDLDHDEVRHWQGWCRHIALSMVALAALTELRAGEKKLFSERFRSACRKSAIC
jgi:SRSO17 transposase